MLFDKLTALCKSKGVSLWKLEKTLGFGNATLSKWMIASPGIDKVQRVADYFGVSVDYLLDRGGDIKLSADSKLVAVTFDNLTPEKQELVKKYVDMLKAG